MDETEIPQVFPVEEPEPAPAPAPVLLDDHRPVDEAARAYNPGAAEDKGD